MTIIAHPGKFLEPDKKKRTTVHCKLCTKVLKYSGNTTNLRYHLELSHRAEFRVLQKSDKEKEKKEANGTSKQQSMTDMLQKSTPIATSSPRWNALTQSICYFIAKDMQPIDTINDKGFRKMIMQFEPRYTPPDRKTIATKYLPQMFEAEKGRIKNLLGTVQHYACTTDLWTSRALHAYMSLTVHYLASDFSLQSHLLETREFPDSHIAVNIVQELEEILQHWSLSMDGLTAITTDNGSNIVLAADLVGCTRVPCFSHCLNLAVEKACKIPAISKALARCRRLVTHFNHSSKAVYVLKQKQEDLHHPNKNLIQDVSTRWNSSYYMVSRVIEQQQPLCAALLELKRTDLMPSDEEFSSMEVYIDVMKPLVSITEAIGAQKWVTISTIRPLLHKLLQLHLVETSTDSRLVKKIKTEMLADLQVRYTGELLLLLSKAAFLDPRLKSLAFLSSSEKEKVTTAVQDEAIHLADLGPVESTVGDSGESSQPPAAKKAKGEHQLFEILDDIINPKSTEDEGLTITGYQKACAEMSMYSSEPATTENPLLWWKANSFRYPLLSSLAKKYLSIPATSVPSERAFSTAGHIVNKKRACLHPSSVNMLVFLSENLL